MKSSQILDSGSQNNIKRVGDVVRYFGPNSSFVLKASPDCDMDLARLTASADYLFKGIENMFDKTESTCIYNSTDKIIVKKKDDIVIHYKNGQIKEVVYKQLVDRNNTYTPYKAIIEENGKICCHSIDESVSKFADGKNTNVRTSAKLSLGTLLQSFKDGEYEMEDAIDDDILCHNQKQ